MFVNKLSLSLLLAFSCIASSEAKRILHDGPHSYDKKGKGRKQQKWRIAGEFTPDENGCYSGEFTNNKGNKVLGTFKECLQGEVKLNKQGNKKFRVKTTFTTTFGDKVETSCRITSKKKDGLGGGYTCKERCKAKDGKGFKFPSDAGGSLIMSGAVDHSNPDVQKFDRLWTLKPETFLYCAKDERTCVPGPNASDGNNGVDLTVFRRRSDDCNFEPCPNDCFYEGEDIGFGNRGLCQDD